MKKTAPLLILASMAFAPAAFSAPAGTLSVHILDQQTGMPPSDVSVTLEKQQQEIINSGGSISSGSGSFMWPTPSTTYVSSPFGTREHPIFHDMRFHSGIDIAAASGATIVAADSGTVVSRGIADRPVLAGHFHTSVLMPLNAPHLPSKSSPWSTVCQPSSQHSAF